MALFKKGVPADLLLGDKKDNKTGRITGVKDKLRFLYAV
jgi:hypothetical protein